MISLYGSVASCTGHCVQRLEVYYCPLFGCWPIFVVRVNGRRWRRSTVGRKVISNKGAQTCANSPTGGPDVLFCRPSLKEKRLQEATACCRREGFVLSEEMTDWPFKKVQLLPYLVAMNPWFAVRKVSLGWEGQLRSSANPVTPESILGRWCSPRLLLKPAHIFK